MKNPAAIFSMILAFAVCLLLGSCGDSAPKQPKMKTWTEVLKMTEYPDGKGGVNIMRESVSRVDILGPCDTSDQMGGGTTIDIWFDKVILDGPTVPKEHQGRVACVQLDLKLNLYYFIIGEPDVGKDCRTPESRKGLPRPTQIK